MPSTLRDFDGPFAASHMAVAFQVYLRHATHYLEVKPPKCQPLAQTIKPMAKRRNVKVLAEGYGLLRSGKSSVGDPPCRSRTPAFQAAWTSQRRQGSTAG